MIARRPALSTTLTRRLVLLALAVTVANVVFVWAYYANDRDALKGYVLRGELDRLEAALDPAALPPRVAEPARTIYRQFPQSYAFAVIDPQGRVRDGENTGLFPAEALTADSFADDWVARRPGPAGTVAIGAHTIRPEGAPPVRLMMMMVDDPANLSRAAILHEFVGHIWIPLLPAVLVLLAANALMIRDGLAPLSRAAAWARSLRPGRPVPPLGVRGLPAEIADLTDATERAVQRLTEGLAAEQRRAAEAAHALRTPVAVLQARADGLPRSPVAAQLRADIDALARMTTQLLDSTGADRIEVADEARADLAAVARAVVERAAPFAVTRGVDLSLTAEASPQMVRGDGDAIALALANLVENAVIHGGSGGRVEVTVGPGPEIHVRDHGPGLPPGAETHMSRPFWRGPGAEPGGAGLGLAIVHRVQRAHGGTVRATDAPGGGALFSLGYTAA